MVSVKVSTTAARAALSELADDIERGVHQALDAAATLAAQAARSTTEFKDRSGQLRGSIDRGPTVAFASSFVAKAPYAEFVENGTQPHTIAARGRMLAFEVNGATVFARSVHHPGTKPTKFMEQTAKNIEPEFARLVEAGVDAAIRRYNA
jgi:HK97 gp10 family phage protein